MQVLAHSSTLVTVSTNSLGVGVKQGNGYKGALSMDRGRAAIVGIISVAFAVSGCGSSAPKPPDKEALDQDAWIKSSVVAKMKLRSILKDADSAKYQNVEGYPFITNDGTTLYYFCGEVNAKNSFGGYTGFSRFIATPVGATMETSSSDFSTGWDQRCVGAGRESSHLF